MIDYALLGRKLVKEYPYLADELIQPPKLIEMNLIPEIWDYYCKIFEGIDKDRTIIFIAVTVKLFDPDAVDGWKPMKHGLRNEISKASNICHTQVSHLLKAARTYNTLYPRFKENIETYFDVIHKKFNDQSETSSE